MENPDAMCTWGNPGCGDILTYYVKIDQETLHITEILFEGTGCTLSQASASILTELVSGKSLVQALRMTQADLREILGDDLVNSRPRCAMLSLETLRVVLREYLHKKGISEEHILQMDLQGGTSSSHSE